VGRLQTVGEMLGWDAESFAQKTIERQQSFVESFTEVMALAYRLVSTIEGSSDDKRAVYANALFARLLQASEAVACVSAYGYAQDAAVILRVALEAFLKLAVVCEEPELAEKAFNAELIEDRKIIDAALERASPSRTEEERRFATSRRDEIRRMEKAGKLEQIDRRSLAKKVSQVDLYDTVFRLTSQYVHPSRRALEEFVIRDGEGKLKAILVKQCADTFPIYVYTALDFVLKGMTYLMELLGVEAPEGYRATVERYKKLEPQWPEEEEANL